MWVKFKNVLNSWLIRLHRPGMIYAYKHNGSVIKETRVSNTTIIEHPENLILGNNVFIGHFNFIEASNQVQINEGCQITNYVSITSHSSHNSIRLYGKEYRKFKDHKGYIKGKVSIGQYTFVGPHSLIMPNTKIGKGSIVKAFSYVKGDFPDFSILEGVPAKVVGDTRDIDSKILKDNPELNTFYEEWLKEKK